MPGEYPEVLLIETLKKYELSGGQLLFTDLPQTPCPNTPFLDLAHVLHGIGFYRAGQCCSHHKISDDPPNYSFERRRIRNGSPTLEFIAAFDLTEFGKVSEFCQKPTPGIEMKQMVNLFTSYDKDLLYSVVKEILLAGGKVGFIPPAPVYHAMYVFTPKNLEASLLRADNPEHFKK